MTVKHQIVATTGKRISAIAASVAPLMALIFLPKCPLCLAASLTLATGVGFSAAGADWVRVGFVLLWAGAVVTLLRGRVWKRASGRFPNATTRSDGQCH